MNTKRIASSLLIVSLVTGLTGCLTEEKREANLEAGAKLTASDAERIALKKVPGGTVKESQLEKEKGKLVWSFDIAAPGSTDLTEVHVDAVTGAILKIQKEEAPALRD